MSKPKFNFDQENFPEHRPGLYGIKNLKNNKWYIGEAKDVAYRILAGHMAVSKWGTEKKFLASLMKNGVESFLVVPLYYAFEYNRKFLLHLEADMIKIYNSVENGYNIISSQEGGYEYGPEFRAICKAIHNTEEVRKKHSAGSTRGHKNPGVKEQHSASMIKAHSKPEVKEKHLKGIHDFWRSREGELERQNKSDNMKAHPELQSAMHSPKARAKWITTIKKLRAENPQIWITNGVQDKLVPKSSLIPSGWRRGYHPRKGKPQVTV